MINCFKISFILPEGNCRKLKPQAQRNNYGVKREQW